MVTCLRYTGKSKSDAIGLYSLVDSAQNLPVAIVKEKVNRRNEHLRVSMRYMEDPVKKVWKKIANLNLFPGDKLLFERSGIKLRPNMKRKIEHVTLVNASGTQVRKLNVDLRDLRSHFEPVPEQEVLNMLLSHQITELWN